MEPEKESCPFVFSEGSVTMLCFIAEIRHDGLVMSASSDSGECYWLPAAEWAGTPPSWNDARILLEPGLAIPVGLLANSTPHENMPLVSARVPEAGELDLAWKGELHVLCIASMSRTLIRGRIGEVGAVISKEEYADFLNALQHNDAVQNHGALAAGDCVCGLFASEEGQEGRVRLSFRDALTRIESDCRNMAESVSQQEDGKAATPKYAEDEDTSPVFRISSPPETLSPVLFVENDELCRRMWRNMLVDAGVDVHAFADYGDALQWIEAERARCRMAILDVHLAGGNDHLGLKLARILCQKPQCRVVLTSAEVSSSEMREKWGDIPIYGYIEKPTLTEEWGTAIDAAVLLDRPHRLHEWLSHVETQDSQRESIRFPVLDVREMTLNQVLAAFCAQFQGMVAHVFRLHPRSWRGRSLANAGGAIKWETYRGKLGKSMLKDVATATERLVDNDCRQDWQHFWTSQMMPYKSFWGQSLSVPGSDRYVLAIFHPAQDAFPIKVDLRAELCAEQVARILSCEHLRRRAEHDFEQSTVGLGFACLAHEIYATLTGVQMAVTRMQGLLDAGKQVDGNEVNSVRETVSDLAKHVPALVSNARILRGSVGGRKEISVLFCLEKAVMAIKEAKKTLLKRPDNVVVELVQADEGRDWSVNANAATLVTVFFNVLLNAIQQIELFSDVRRKGWVGAELQHYEDEAGAPWAVIRIRDTGPGIHPEDWDRVFEPGYSTKEEGTGLGLYICRQALAGFRERGRQASIQITRSVLWAGTTVTIRLPLPQPAQGGSQWERLRPMRAS